MILLPIRYVRVAGLVVLLLAPSCKEEYGGRSGDQAEGLVSGSQGAGDLDAAVDSAQDELAGASVVEKSTLREKLVKRPGDYEQIISEWAEIREFKWIGDELESAKKDWARKA